MTVLTFLPLAIVLGVIALLENKRRRSAERHAREWEKIARKTGDALKECTETLKDSTDQTGRLLRVVASLTEPSELT